MVKKGTKTPVEKSQNFYYHYEEEKEGCFINIYQGECRKVKGNKKIGSFELNGLTKGKKIEEKLLVTFEIQASGLLRIFAKSLDDSSVHKEIKVNCSALSAEEISKAIKDSAKFHEAMDLQKEFKVLCNKLEDIIENVKCIEDNKDNERRYGSERFKKLIHEMEVAEEWLEDVSIKKNSNMVRDKVNSLNNLIIVDSPSDVEEKESDVSDLFS